MILSNPMNRAFDMARLLSADGSAAITKVSPFWGRLKAALSIDQSGRLFLFAGSLLISATTLASTILWLDGFDLGVIWAVLFLGLVAAVAERQSVQVHAHTDGSVSVLPILLAAVVLGPGPAMVVAFASFLSYLGRPYTRWVVWTSSRVVVAGLAGVAAGAFSGAEPLFIGLFVATAVGALVEGFGSSLLASMTVGIRHPGSFRPSLRATFRVMAVTIPLYTPMVAVLAYAFIQLSPWAVLFFAMPALAAQRLLSLYQRQAMLAEDIAAVNARLEGASVSFAGALVAALDARDQYTAGHSAAVAVYARDIAREYGLDEHDQHRVHLAGLLHDIGKVGLPPGILEKVGPLSPQERTRMEAHSVIGERIIRNVDGFEDLAAIVRHHHERLDGAGYPDCLRGDEIPVMARIIAVADAYNAMTSGRPYREALTTIEAQRRLAEAAGTQFDPSVVAAFERLLQSSVDAYLVAEQADFAVEANWRAVVSAPVGVAA